MYYLEDPFLYAPFFFVCLRPFCFLNLLSKLGTHIFVPEKCIWVKTWLKLKDANALSIVYLKKYNVFLPKMAEPYGWQSTPWHHTYPCQNGYNNQKIGKNDRKWTK